MKLMAGRKRHSAEDIVRKLRRADELAAEGKTGEEIAAELGVSAATLYNWRRAYGGMDTDAAKELTELREQNARLKRSLAEAELAAMCLIVPSSPILGPQDLKQPDSFTGNRRMRAHRPDSAGLQSRKNRGRPTATTHALTAKSHLPIKIEAPFRWAAPVGAVRVAAVVGNV